MREGGNIWEGAGDCIESPNMGGGVIEIRQAVKQAVRELPSCHHKSLAGQRDVAEIIPQIILLLTVRAMRNKGQQCMWRCTRGGFLLC